MTSDNRFFTTIPCLVAFSVLAGCGGSSNRQNTPPPPAPDTVAPSVGSIATGAGSSVNRTATLTVTANDNVGVSEVRFFVDGTLIEADQSSPYSVAWDTSSVTDGDHVLRAEAEDAAGNVGQSVELTVTVANTAQFDIALTGEQEVPSVDSTGTAAAGLTVNLATGAVEGELSITGIDVTAAHIHDAFAGTNGPVLIGLEQDATDPSIYRVPANAMLDTDGIDKLLAAGLYLNAHTEANPGGELRGQMLPQDFVLYFTALSGDNEVSQVDSVAGGRAAVTVNTVTGAVVVQARVTGLDEASAAHVHDAFAGSNGPVLVGLAQDPLDAVRWFVEDGVLSAGSLDAFAAGRLYVNVHSPANPGGEVRGQIIPDGISLLMTELSGEQEVPAVETAASGVGFLTRDVAASQLTIHVNTRNLPDASAAHLHGAFGGTNGGVEIGLTQDGSDPSHWFTELASLSAEQTDALLSGATYLNVHTPGNPGGEIRGQVIPEGILFATGRLEGSQEVPAVVSAARGTFAVTVDPAGPTLEAHANTTGADDAVAAHLHDAYAGTSGGVAIGLTQDASDVSRWSASGVALTADHLAAFEAGRLYVNVHTPANPGGEIRGQMAPAPVEVLFVELSGDQEVPAVTSAVSGVAAVTTNRETGVVTLHLRAEGADDAVAAHIHGGFAGSNSGVLIGLTQDPGDVTHWSIVEAQFDETGLVDYLDGRTYVNLHTPANPGGEIRGQIVPENIRVLFSAMDGNQVVPAVTTAASGVASSTVNLATRRFVVFVNASGVNDATSAGIHAAPPGANGAQELPLTQDATDPGQWSAETEPLDRDTYLAYRGGNLYAQVATPAEPDSEIRGQIVPADAGEFDISAPTVSVSAPTGGSEVSDTVALTATADDNLGVAVVRFFVDGNLIGSDTTEPYTVDWDTTSVANGEVTLVAEADDVASNTGTSTGVTVTVANAAPVSLAQIQADVFTPACSGCHSGPTGTTLPSGMNLSSAAASHAALVNVTSLQVGSLNRVTPGNPDDSYLIRKLEGTQAVGSRMPQGGPFLDQATIDNIRQWITEGAPNN